MSSDVEDTTTPEAATLEHRTRTDFDMPLHTDAKTVMPRGAKDSTENPSTAPEGAEPEYKTQVADLNTQARAHLTKGEWEEAVALYTQARDVLREAGDGSGEAEALNNIASVYLAMDKWPEALDFGEQSRALFKTTGDQKGEATVLNDIAAAYNGMGNWPKAEELYEEALALRQATGDAEGEAKTLRNLAIVFAQHGNPPKAKTYLTKALLLAKEAKSKEMIATIRKTLSQLPRFRR